MEKKYFASAILNLGFCIFRVFYPLIYTLSLSLSATTHSREVSLAHSNKHSLITAEHMGVRPNLADEN